MADTGMIHKSYDFYVDDELSGEAITKGAVIHCNAPTNQRVMLVDGDATDVPPYGVALETCTAAAMTISACWRGVVECTCTPAATIYKNTAVYSATAGVMSTGWSTAIAEYRIIGHLLDTSITTATAECKIMLAGW
jgi:hypothetical protein